MSVPSTNVDQWTKKSCIDFLRGVKGAKVSVTKNELIARVKAYLEHPDILESIQNAPEISFPAALDIDSLEETTLQWISAKENLPCVTVSALEAYVNTQKQAAQAM
jgi:hypothetical protein